MLEFFSLAPIGIISKRKVIPLFGVCDTYKENSPLTWNNGILTTKIFSAAKSVPYSILTNFNSNTLANYLQ